MVLIAAVVGGIWYGRRQPAEVVDPLPRPASRPQFPRSRRSRRAAGGLLSAIARDFRVQAEWRRAASERGKEIYYYKCWFCHNDFAEGAPKLTGVYQRGTLITGRPATDDGIKEQIREGSPGMASYKYTLSETDIDDLVTFIREACCWKDDEPPLNPRYVAK